MTPLLLAHYMPWFVAKPFRSLWGWHWTMNTCNPDKQLAGKRELASHYYPLLGPYVELIQKLRGKSGDLTQVRKPTT